MQILSFMYTLPRWFDIQLSESCVMLRGVDGINWSRRLPIVQRTLTYTIVYNTVLYVLVMFAVPFIFLTFVYVQVTRALQHSRQFSAGTSVCTIAATNTAQNRTGTLTTFHLNDTDGDGGAEQSCATNAYNVKLKAVTPPDKLVNGEEETAMRLLHVRNENKALTGESNKCTMRMTTPNER